MARESFEIYYYQSGRWSVHATFEGNEREAAMAEAQKVEKSLGLPVRLVRETFYPEENKSDVVVSWQSAKAKQMGDAEDMFGDKNSGKKGGEKKKAPPKQKPKPAPAPAPRREKPPAAEKEKSEAAKPTAAKKPPAKRKPKGKPGRGVATKLAVVVSMSLAVSALLVGVATFAVYVLTDRLHVLPEEDRSAQFAGLFIVTYAASALYYLGKQFNIRYGWSRTPKTASPGASDMIQRMKRAAPTPIANPDEGFTQADVQEVTDTVAPPEEIESADRTGADDFATAVESGAAPEPPETIPPEAMPPNVAAPPAPPPTPAAEPVPPKAAEPPPERKPEPPSAEAEARRGFLGFVGEAMTAAQREHPDLNAFSRFGLNLYLAGAAAAIGQARKVGRTPQLAILRDGLQAAGTSRERAENFCAELPSYGKNPRYAGMIQAGGAAMTRQLSGQPASTNELGALLADWGKPEKRTAVPSAFTFLFTDIVNSTALTSQLGNAGAQRVVRAHNTAVRGAIQAYGGREVKHTGDGIMATFPTPAAAVQAGIRAQKELAAHSAANPSTAFTIRIGINVGEAVEEDNDFFGAAVQMTARICAACTPANVWVSRAVVDACKGERLGFIPRGAFQMKGIQQARPLYEVAYTDAHKNELANL
jgi:adenylate cyclase